VSLLFTVADFGKVCVLYVAILSVCKKMVDGKVSTFVRNLVLPYSEYRVKE